MHHLNKFAPSRALLGATALGALFALTGCPGDDVTSTGTDGDESTGGEDTTGGVVTTTPMTTMAADSTGGDTMSEDTTAGDTMADDTTAGDTMADDTTAGDTMAEDTTAGETCGNGELDADEDCDGDELDGEDCVSQGFVGGDLACADDCTFDISSCVEAVCGNDAIEGDEACEGKDLDGEDCVSQGFDAGELACAKDCTLDDTACVNFMCGNDAIDGKDVCDGTDLDGEDCVSQGFDGGTLACAENCGSFDTSGCFTCGDDATNGAEVCDGADVNGEDCVSQGFEGGTLGCAEACDAYDTSACFTCGDDVIGGAEVCDGADLAGEDCVSQGFSDGTLGCALDCGAFDTSACTNDVCGDGAITGAEVCEPDDLNANDCGTEGFAFGLAQCAADCLTIDTSLCSDTPQFCSVVGEPIGPALGTITLDSISVPALGDFITDVNVFVDASHSFTGDMEMDVRHVESGAQTRLLEDQCATEEDTLATFDQDAAALPACGDPIAVEGDVLPFGNLDTVIGVGDVPSTWELEILDDANLDGGTLNTWCVQFEIGADPNTCGDDTATVGEQCDGADLNGESCTSLGFINGGTLACDVDCGYDTTACDASEGICGDGVITNDGNAPDEDCDGNELASTTCEDLGFVGGSLDCSAPSCGFDTSDCSNAVIAMCATPGSPFVFEGPDAVETFTFVDLGNVGDVDVFVDISHGWVSDVDLTLTNVDADITVDLLTDECGSADDVFAFFNDEASSGVPDCLEPAAVEGNLNADTALSVFDGLPIAGDWQFTAIDDENGIDGTLNEVCVYITPDAP